MTSRPVVLVLLLGAGCSVAGEREERDLADRAGRPYEEPYDRRKLPALVPAPARADVLQFAFLSSPDLERAYFEWRAALERVPQESSLEAPALGFERMFSKERMSAWDRTTLGARQAIPFPGKLAARGRVALQEAVAARRRFEDAKFRLQAEVVEAYEELLLTDRSIAIARENLALLKQFVEVSNALLGAGKARQVDLTKAELEAAGAENDLASIEARRRADLSRLNRLLARPPDAALAPAAPEAPAALPAEDAKVLELAAERNPELAAVVAEIRGREEALELARKAWLPDFEISFSVTGSVERMLGAMLTAPLQVGRIRAGIEEARANLRAAQAALRSRGDDLKARLVLDLYLARDGERRHRFLEATLLVKAREVVENVREAYGTGGATFLELLDAQRALLEFRLESARLDAQRRTSLARLEATCAVDFGTLGQAERR